VRDRVRTGWGPEGAGKAVQLDTTWAGGAHRGADHRRIKGPDAEGMVIESPSGEDVGGIRAEMSARIWRCG
jgi:hypothetical protein